MLERLLPLLVMPLGIALSGLTVALILHHARPRAAFAATVTAWGVLAVFALPVTSAALIGSLERRHPTLAIEAVPRGGTAVLLGGGIGTAPAPRDGGELTASGDRLHLVARLWHAGRLTRVIASGGGGGPDENADGIPDWPSEAELGRDALALWGVPAERVLLESGSGDTRANALAVAALIDGLEPAPGRLYLITSAMHMPRAMVEFERVGLDVVAVPANRWIGDRGPRGPLAWVPDAIALGGSSRALREYLGLAVAGLAARGERAERAERAELADRAPPH